MDSTGELFEKVSATVAKHLLDDGAKVGAHTEVDASMVVSELMLVVAVWIARCPVRADRAALLDTITGNWLEAAIEDMANSDDPIVRELRETVLAQK